GLVGVGGRSDRDGFATPAPPGQLHPEDERSVDLDEDDPREVVARGQLEVGVIPPGETVMTAVRTPPVRIRAPPEPHPPDGVQHALRLGLSIDDPAHERYIHLLRREGQQRSWHPSAPALLPRDRKVRGVRPAAPQRRFHPPPPPGPPGR